MKMPKMSGWRGIAYACLFAESMLFLGGAATGAYDAKLAREKIKIENTYSESNPASRVLLFGYRKGLEFSVLLGKEK